MLAIVRGCRKADQRVGAKLFKMKKTLLILALIVLLPFYSNAVWVFYGSAEMTPLGGGSYSLACPGDVGHCASFHENHTVYVEGWGWGTWVVLEGSSEDDMGAIVEFDG